MRSVVGSLCVLVLGFSVACSSGLSGDEGATPLKRPVPRDVTACGVLSASAFNDVLGQEMTRYEYKSWERGAGSFRYRCDVRVSDGQYGVVAIGYGETDPNLDYKLFHSDDAATVAPSPKNIRTNISSRGRGPALSRWTGWRVKG